MSKAYDLVVVTGTYTTRDGEVKKSYKNIGIVNQTDKGMYILLDRTFNPAGVPNPENKDMLMVSMFEPKDSNNSSSGNTAERRTASNKAQAPNSFADDLDDEIPF